MKFIPQTNLGKTLLEIKNKYLECGGTELSPLEYMLQTHGLTTQDLIPHHKEILTLLEKYHGDIKDRR